MTRVFIAMAFAAMLLSAAPGELQQRKEEQQKRIGKGIENGSLTPKEAAHLEHRETKINRQVRRERAANGGKLTPSERARVNREQNRTSRAIYNQKHDAQGQPR